MKKLLTFILLAFICNNLKAQIYVEGVQLDSTNTGAYLIISRGGLGAPFIIDVDYGQSNKSSSCEVVAGLVFDTQQPFLLRYADERRCHALARRCPKPDAVLREGSEVFFQHDAAIF